jgi:hypothetical protein
VTGPVIIRWQKTHAIWKRTKKIKLEKDERVRESREQSVEGFLFDFCQAFFRKKFAEFQVSALDVTDKPVD